MSAACNKHSPAMMNTEETTKIERLTSPVTDSDIRALAQLLVDTVESGAAVSFLATLKPEDAESW